MFRQWLEYKYSGSLTFFVLLRDVHALLVLSSSDLSHQNEQVGSIQLTFHTMLMHVDLERGVPVIITNFLSQHRQSILLLYRVISRYINMLIYRGITNLLCSCC